MKEETNDNNVNKDKQQPTSSNNNNDITKELESTLSNLTLNEQPQPPKSSSSSSSIYDSDKYKTFISHLKNGDFTNIIFMTGAGISTSAGIPDFRSKNGLFRQLQDKYNLSTPEEFFDIKTFLTNPTYFYEFYKQFDSETYNPTVFHYFMGFLCYKKYVKMIFTQNIDGLEHKCGIDEDKLIFAHGNFDEGHCPNCYKDIDIKLIRTAAYKDEVYYCPDCDTPCKPKIVFYREDLPKRFYQQSYRLMESDLGIICGTSLLVAPFNGLPYKMHKYSWRVVINKSPIGEITGKRAFQYMKEDSKDLLIKGYSDDVVKRIIKDCEWEEEFEKFVSQTKEANR